MDRTFSPASSLSLPPADLTSFNFPTNGSPDEKAQALLTLSFGVGEMQSSCSAKRIFIGNCVGQVCDDCHGMSNAGVSATARALKALYKRGFLDNTLAKEALTQLNAALLDHDQTLKADITRGTICRILGASAEIFVRDDVLLSHMCKRLVEQLKARPDDDEPQNIQSSLCATFDAIHSLHRLRYNNRDLMRECLARLFSSPKGNDQVWRVDYLTNSNFVRVVQLASHEELYHPNTITALSQEAERRGALFTAPESLEIGFHLSRLGSYPSSLMASCEEILTRRYMSLSAIDVAHGARLFFSFNVSRPDIFESIVCRAEQLKKYLEDHQLVDILKCAIVTGESDQIERVWNLIDHRNSDFSYSPTAQSFLRSAIALCRRSIPEKFKTSSYDTSDSINSFTSDQKRPSMFELSVERCLEAMGIFCGKRQIVGGYIVDLVGEHNGKKIYIECDGYEPHFIRNDRSVRPVGRDQLQKWIFDLHSLPLLRIDVEQWNGLPTDEQKRRFLLGKVEGLLAS